MSFTGSDYHDAFRKACETLARERDPRAVQSELETMEWILWEAIRGVFAQISLALAFLMVAPIAYLLNAERSVLAGVVYLAATAFLGLFIYWVCRLFFHFEIARHVKGRRFGSITFHE